MRTSRSSSTREFFAISNFRHFLSHSAVKLKSYPILFRFESCVLRLGFYKFSRKVTILLPRLKRPVLHLKASRAGSTGGRSRTLRSPGWSRFTSPMGDRIIEKGLLQRLVRGPTNSYSGHIIGLLLPAPASAKTCCNGIMICGHVHSYGHLIHRMMRISSGRKIISEKNFRELFAPVV